MPNPDRAEIRPSQDRRTPVKLNFHQQAILYSHVLREYIPNSLGRVAAAFGIAASGGAAIEAAKHFSGNVSAVEAADCRVGARIESYTFFDMAQVLPEMGRRHIIDMGIDPRVGAAAGFTLDAVPMTYKKGDRNKPDYKPLASTNIVRDQQNNAGRGELRFTTTCNTTTVTSEGKTVPAVKFKLTSNLEDNDQFEVVVGHDRRVPVFVGSEIKKGEDFLRMIDAGLAVKDLTDKKKELIQQAQKKTNQPPTGDGQSGKPEEEKGKEGGEQKEGEQQDGNQQGGQEQNVGGEEARRNEEVKRNIEQRGNPPTDPYRYERTIIGLFSRIIDWKW